MSEKKHFYELDRLNCILCFLVIFIHAFGAVAYQMPENSFERMFSVSLLRNCTFAVQSFIFLSGLKYSVAMSKGNFKYFRFLWKRLIKVVVPYIICSAVYYMCYRRIGRVPVTDIPGCLAFLVNGNLESHFYFVVVIAQFYLLMPLWYLFSRRVKMPLTILMGLVLGILWIILYVSKIDFYDRVFMTYLPYWMFGIAAGSCYEVFKKGAEKYFALFFVIFLITAIVDGPVFYYVTGWYVRIYAYEIIHMLYSFSAIMVLYNLCCMSDGKPSLYQRAINGFSYEIYLWHCLILTYADIYIGESGITSYLQILSIRFGTVVVIMTVISFIVYFIKFLGKRRRIRT